MEISELKQEARETLKKHWWSMVFVVVISLVAATIELNIPYLSDGLNIFLIAPIFVGVRWFYLSVIDGERPNTKAIFASFNDYYRVTLASFLISLFTVLWGLLFVIPGIMKACAYSQTLYLIKDNPDIGVLEAIRKSQEIMEGHKSDYAATVFSFIGWVLVPVILGFYLFAVTVNNEVSQPPTREFTASMTDQTITITIDDEIQSMSMSDFDQKISTQFQDGTEIIVSRHPETFVFTVDEDTYVLSEWESAALDGMWLRVDSEGVVLTFEDEWLRLAKDESATFISDTFELDFVLTDHMLEVTTGNRVQAFPLEEKETRITIDGMEIVATQVPRKGVITMNDREVLTSLGDKTSTEVIDGTHVSVGPNTDYVAIFVNGWESLWLRDGDSETSPIWNDFSLHQDYTIELNLSFTGLTLTSIDQLSPALLLMNLYILIVSFYLKPYFGLTMAAYYRQLRPRPQW